MSTRRIEETSRITAKGQTTVPRAVRKALGLASGDTVRFDVRGDRVVLTRATGTETADPAIATFLGLLAKDIAAGNIRADLPEEVRRAVDSVAGLDVDPDDAIEGEVDI